MSVVTAGTAVSVTGCLLAGFIGVGDIYDTKLSADFAEPDPEFVQMVEELEQYVTLDQGVVLFDITEAEEDGASDELLSLGDTLNDFSEAFEEYDPESDSFEDEDEYQALSASTNRETLVSNTLLYNPSEASLQVQRAGVPMWGNWCGPGHGGGIARDRLDSLCRTHDRCYGSKGYFACSCDRALVSGISKNSSKMKSKERAMASVVSVYFRYSPCNPLK